MDTCILSGRNIFSAFFEKGSDELHYKCTIENCNSVIKQDIKRGYQCLVNHAKTHPNREADVQSSIAFDCSGSGSLNKFMVPTVSEKAKTYFGYLELVVHCNLPLTVVRNTVLRKYLKLEKICYATLINYLEKVCEVVEESIRDQIPDKFIILMDGWTADGSQEHYVGIVATWVDNKGNVQRVLLSCGPQDDDDTDDMEFTAEALGDYIFDELKLVGKGFENIDLLLVTTAQ